MSRKAVNWKAITPCDGEYPFPVLTIAKSNIASGVGHLSGESPDLVFDSSWLTLDYLYLDVYCVSTI